MHTPSKTHLGRSGENPSFALHGRCGAESARPCTSRPRPRFARCTRQGSRRIRRAPMRARCATGRPGFGCDIARSWPCPVPIPVVLQFVVDHVARIEAGARVHDLPPAIDEALVSAGIQRPYGALPSSQPSRIGCQCCRRRMPYARPQIPFGTSQCRNFCAASVARTRSAANCRPRSKRSPRIPSKPCWPPVPTASSAFAIGLFCCLLGRVEGGGDQR